VTPQQAAVFRWDVLNYLQYIGFTLTEALRLMPSDPNKLMAFRMAFMVDEDREPATDPKELS
jgi:hypothetical protein